LQHWTVANTPDLTGVIAAVTGQLTRLGGEINPPLVTFANAQLDALFAAQEATEPAHGATTETIAGNVIIQTTAGVPLIVSRNPSSPAPLAIVGGVNAITQFVGGNGPAASILIDSFANAAIIMLRRTDGSLTAPTTVQSGDTIGILGFRAFSGDYADITVASVRCLAAEAFTATAQGANLRFTTTPIGTISALERLQLRADGGFTIPAGNSTATPGNATINLATGRSAIAAGAATVTITNSLVSATSIVLAVLQTNDATAILKNVVPAAGSFAVNLTAAATANTNFGWWTIN
jgi:hypothetical protein